MGWSGGTDICIEAWDEIREFVKKEDRPYCLKVLIEALQNADWDNLDEIKDQKWPELKLAIQLVEGDDGED
jgi:hypothetical protein